jgi:hypothetical protein
VSTAFLAIDWCGTSERCDVMGDISLPYMPDLVRDAESTVEVDERTALTMSRLFTPLPENDMAR